MIKAIALSVTLVPLSVTAEAAAIQVVPTVTGSASIGSISAYTADVAPYPYHVEGNLFDNPFTFQSVSGKSVVQDGTSHSFSRAVLDTQQAPTLTSHSEASTYLPGPAAGGNNAGFYYYFQIAGPTTTNVPIFVQAAGQVKTQGLAAIAKAAFGLVGPGANFIDSITIQQPEPSSGQYGLHEDSFKISQSFSLSSNTEYRIAMNVSTFAANNHVIQGSSYADALVDPYLSIAPGYSDFSLVFSDGINNLSLSAVPLPASAPMFGAAVLALGVTGYGMKRKRAAASG